MLFRSVAVSASKPDCYRLQMYEKAPNRLPLLRFIRTKLYFHTEETSKSAVKGCESAWTGSVTSRRIMFSPEVFGNLHRGNQKFFRTSKSFFRTFISFFRIFISPLRGDFCFPPSYLGISSEELTSGRRKKKKTQPLFVQRLSLICIVSVLCQKERQRLVS